MRERDLTILLIGLALGSIISYLVHAGYKELTGSEVSWQIDILITSILALVVGFILYNYGKWHRH